MAPDQEQLVEAQDRIRRFAAQLQRENGYTPLLVCDALIAAGINAAVILAGAEAVAATLFEFAEDVRRLGGGAVKNLN